MATNSFTRTDSHATSAAGGGWSSSRIAITAVLCALALVVSFIEIPLFPPAPWLKYDPSGVVALLAGLALGPATGIMVAVLSWLLHLLISFNPYGVIMALIALVSYVAPACAIAARRDGLGGAIVGMCAGGLISIAACIVANLFITPLYANMPQEAVVAMVVPILLPFNLIKVVVTSAISAVLYKPVLKILQR